MGLCFSCSPCSSCCRKKKKDNEIPNDSIESATNNQNMNKSSTKSDTLSTNNLKTKNIVNYKDITKHYEVTDKDFNSNINNCLKTLKLNYEISEQIGSGGFGVVFKGINTDSQTFIACKRIHLLPEKLMIANKAYRKAIKAQFKNLKNELFTLMKAKHDNIIKVYDHFIINNYCYIIMELASGGNLSEKVTKSGPFNEQLAKKYFSQIVNAIYYLKNDLKIAHRDLKLANALICITDNGNNIIKVTDFGTSRVRLAIQSSQMRIIKDRVPVGTVAYMSPQVLELFIKENAVERDLYGDTESYDPFAADIWCLGVCLYFMLTKKLPFKPKSDPRLLKNMLDDQRNSEWDLPKDIKDKISDHCINILKTTLDPNPETRFTINKLINHIWLSDAYN